MLDAIDMTLVQGSSFIIGFGIAFIVGCSKKASWVKLLAYILTCVLAWLFGILFGYSLAKLSFPTENYTQILPVLFGRGFWSSLAGIGCGILFAQRKTGPNPFNPKTELKNKDKIIAELRVKKEKAIASRDKWKKIAEDAEIKIKELENKILESQTTETNSKFKMVKNKFSQMYHPDKIKGDRFEKMIKQEIFKEFWQEIKKIEDI